MRTVSLPSSKSIALRTLLLASVAQGVSVIEGITLCDDVQALLANFQALGITYSVGSEAIEIRGGRWQRAEHLDCGESGFLARTLPFLSALQGHEGRIEGRGSLVRRNLDDLSTLFAAAGGKCHSHNGTLPMTYSPLLPQEEITVSHLSSSQGLSGLLMGLPLTDRVKRLKFFDIPSRGYIDATIRVMRKFDGLFEVKEVLNGREVEVVCSNTHMRHHGYRCWHGKVEADWSAAAQVIATLQVGETLCLLGLDADSLQPDRKILDVVTEAGWDARWEEGALYLKASGALRPFAFDASDCPDLFPALAALASQAVGKSEIRGIHRLRNKESDRAEALQTMLSRYGLPCAITGDTLYVEGGSPLATETIPTFHDHRIAMAAAAIGLRCPTPPVLDDVVCVAKSYPRFFDCLPRRG